MSGTLYICPTPIGNLGDVTERVVRTLKSVAVIGCEDTRTSGVFLKACGIETPLVSYHKFNEQERSDSLIDRLLAGDDVAIISDAGMPGISDPGEVIVRRAADKGICVSALPGPSACVTALAMSGLSTRRFAFEGFLPQGKKEKQAVLKRLENSCYTTVIYEAPHRLDKTLSELATAAGERNAACVREISKRFEEVRRGKLSELAAYYAENEPRGEFVVIIEGISDDELAEMSHENFSKLSIAEHMALYSDMDEKAAMKRVAEERGISKRDVYQAVKREEREERD